VQGEEERRRQGKAEREVEGEEERRREGKAGKMAKRKERRGGRRGGKQGRKEEGERGEEKAKEEEEEKKGKGTHPLHPFCLITSRTGCPGSQQEAMPAVARSPTRHHWHCLGDLTPVLASYSDITGLFVPLVSPTHVPRTALGTTKWDDVMPARTPEDSDECRGAQTTFSQVQKRGKGTTDGNRPT
jgi:hypothetical protein